MSTPKVSFFMMAYNAEAYVEKAVRSVLNQTEKDINIFVIINGSVDKTGEILQKLQNEDSRVFFITNKKNGIRDNGKQVFENGWWYYEEEMLGEYISIIDSDDWIKEDFVETLYSKAKESGMDITIGGTNFVDSNDDIKGSRFLPDMVLSNINYIGNNFPILYNNFRTWWGKLFEKEFFIKNYDYAWLPKFQIISDLPYYKIDTTIMMCYLEKCNGVCCVSKSLYNFYMRQNSEYSSRFPSVQRFSEAYSIYSHGMSVLQKYNLCSPENISFIVRVHWCYIYENFNNVVNYKNISVDLRYAFLECIANDKVCKNYWKSMYEEILMDLKPVLMQLEEQYVNDYNIYKSFMAKFNKFIDMAGGEQWNPCALIVILSVLCDPKNKGSFGEEFSFFNKEGMSDILLKSLKVSEAMKNVCKSYPSVWISYIENMCDKTRYDDKKSEMRRFAESGEYDSAAGIAVDILEENPVDFEALICIIKYCVAVKDNVLANLLKESMSVIWDAETVELSIKSEKFDEEIMKRDKWKINF